MGWVTRDVRYDDKDFGKAFPCPDCKEKELQAKRKAEMQEAINDKLRSGGFSIRHALTFDDFLNLPDELRAGKEIGYEACQIIQANKRLVMNGVEKPGLVLWGKFGTGKTTLATSAMIAEAAAGGVILRIKFGDFLDDVQDTYGRQDVHGEDLIKLAQTAPMVMVDDLGDPNSNQPMTKDQQRIAFKFFDYRNEQMLTTIITTNLEAKYLSDGKWTSPRLMGQVGERTFERIRELCHAVEVTGKNLRQ